VVGRPSFGQGRSGWAGRAAERQTITLPPLDPAAAGSLARRLLAPVENIPSSALARLAERTMGVPLLLVELCRGLKRDGVVRRSENGAWFLATDELERLPDLPLVQWLSSRETESLPPDLLAHARLASVLGVEFSSDEVEGVLQELERAGAHAETQLDAGIGLRRLSDSGLLTQHRGGRVGFRHSLLRDTVYQSVPPPEREAIHRAAYEYFRRQDRLPDEARMPQMAFHASKSGLAVEAGRLYLTLAGRASARHAYLDAELLYHSALENLPANDVPSRIAVEQGLGLMRFRTGRHDDALKDFSAALDLAGQIDARSARINILLDKALVLDWTMDWPGSRALSEEAAALVAADPSLATPGISPRVLMAQGRILYRSNHYAEGAAAFRQTVDAASQVGDEGYEAYTQSLSMLAFCTSMIGLYDEAREALRRGMEVVEQHGDMVGLAGLLQNRVILSFLTNDVELMLADLERIIQISREYGFLMSECMAVRDLAEVNFILGRTEEALSNVHRAIEAYSQQVGSSRRIVFNAEVLRARIMSYRGDAAGAEEIVRRVIARQAEAVASGLTEAVLTDGERVLLDALDLSLRSAPDADFDALAARGRELQLQPQEVVEIMEWKGIAALRSGRRAEGLQFLEEALAEANRTAKLAADRVRGQIAQALAATEPSPAVGSAQR
jgi:tetratricopeptide (TPR) repeat protein